MELTQDEGKEKDQDEDATLLTCPFRKLHLPLKLSGVLASSARQHFRDMVLYGLNDHTLHL